MSLDPGVDEWRHLSAVRGFDSFVDMYTDEDLFKVQYNLSVHAPQAMHMGMRWKDAGQLPLLEAIRILELMNSENAELVREIEKIRQTGGK